MKRAVLEALLVVALVAGAITAFALLAAWWWGGAEVYLPFDGDAP